MDAPDHHGFGLFSKPVHASAGGSPQPFYWPCRIFAVLSLLLVAGCNYPVASRTDVDVCALARDAVAAAFDETFVTEPGPGTCLFHADGIGKEGARVQVMLLTRASLGSSGHLDRAVRLSMAEAEATYGHAGVPEFGDLAKVAVAFGSNPPETINDVVVAERGVMMEVVIGGGVALGHDAAVALTRELWTRVTHYKRPPN
jgi:hypothetical protein